MVMTKLFAFTVIVFVSYTYSALAQNVYPGTCSYEDARCVKFCKDSGRGESCYGDCRNRQTSCLKTGTYYWINSPTRTGLERK
jgi:hypothetical protein